MEPKKEHAVGPDGRVVERIREQPLKPGWRIAEPHEYEPREEAPVDEGWVRQAEKAAAQPQTIIGHPEPEPEFVHESIVELTSE